MPAAVEHSIWLALGANDRGLMRAYAADLKQEFEGSLPALTRNDQVLWVNYLVGVLQYLRNQGHPLKGIDVVFGGDIPIGAGLSSSAAISCGLCAGVNAMAELGLENLEMAKAAQWAEHHFAGTLCGLMDQMANLYAKPESAFLLEHQTLQITYVPFDLSSTTLVLFNTMVKHELANSAYNDRRRVCETAVSMLNQAGWQGRFISDFKGVSRDLMGSILDEEPLRLVRFILDENKRVHSFSDAIQQGNWVEAGSILYLSHTGLAEEYKVSCKEADALISISKQISGVYGGRMMGGGFGGCVLFMVDKISLESIIQEISKRYFDLIGVFPESYRVQLGRGTEVVFP